MGVLEPVPHRYWGIIAQLKKKWDDRGFVCGIMSGLRQAGKVDEMLTFLSLAERRGDMYSSDQITALTIAMRKKDI